MTTPLPDWRLTTIGALGRILTGRTPPSAKPELFGSDYPFITPTDIQEGQHFVRTERFLSEEGLRSQSSLLLPSEAICFVCIGATIGKICITDRPSFTNQQINSIIVDQEHDHRFVYHLLRFRADRIKAQAGGAATPIVNKTAFSNVEVLVPALPVQRRIGEILAGYDDLIENNIRRIGTLEEMATMIYREWFVNLRFPGHEKARMVNSEMGPIPDGWRIGQLGDIADIQWGDTSVTKASYVPEPGFRAYSASGPDGWLDYFDFDRTGVVLSAIGANCGLTWFAAGKWSCIKNTIWLWATDKKTTTEFLYFATKETDFWPKRGSAQPFVSLGDARSKRLLIPPYSLASVFSECVRDILMLVDVLQRKARNLSETRDLLLPKLISGDINVGRSESGAVAWSV